MIVDSSEVRFVLCFASLFDPSQYINSLSELGDCFLSKFDFIINKNMESMLHAE